MKNKILIFLLLTIPVQLLKAQINAVTETGDEVVLYENRTWRYLKDSLNTKVEIPLNKAQFEKHRKSTFLVKSKNLNIGVWINPKIWSFEKAAETSAAELKFKKKGDDLYAMLVSEKMEIPIETLKNVALNNAKKVSPDVKIITEEYRVVNGIKVLMMQMGGTIQGTKFRYYGYYYSNSSGSIQLIAYTGENLFDTYKKDIEQFLNGLVQK